MKDGAQPEGQKTSERFCGHEAGMFGLEVEMEVWRVRHVSPDGFEYERTELRSIKQPANPPHP